MGHEQPICDGRSHVSFSQKRPNSGHSKIIAMGRFFSRSLRQVFPGTILQLHDFAAVPVDSSPHAAFHNPVLAANGFLLAADAYHRPTVLEGKSPVIARRYHHPQLAVDIADLAINLRLARSSTKESGALS